MISRTLFARHMGFDLSEWMWQILDFDLLRNDLGQSIFYLHSQPPLLNLFLGIVLKLAAGTVHAQEFMRRAFQLLGLLLLLSMFLLMVDLQTPMAIAMVLTVLFEFNPGSLMLENRYYNTYPTEVLLTLSALCLFRALTRGRNLYAVGFLVSAALPILLNSSFQPIWFIIVCAFGYYRMHSRVRELIPTAVVMFLLIGILVLKNAVLFGTFTTSSWLGMNLARMTTFQLTDRIRQSAIRSGELSEYASVGAFSKLDAYPMVSAKPTGIPILDLPSKSDGTTNYNNIRYVTIGAAYLSDALRTAFFHPAAYARGIVKALGCFLGPLKDQDHIDKSARLGVWNNIYNLLLAPASLQWWPRPRDCVMSLTILVGLPLILALVLIRLLRTIVWGPAEVTFAFMLLAIAYTILTGTLFDFGENARFRSVIDPLILILLGSLITDLVRATPPDLKTKSFVKRLDSEKKNPVIAALSIARSVRTDQAARKVSR